jgi:hypothetical protein
MSASQGPPPSFAARAVLGVSSRLTGPVSFRNQRHHRPHHTHCKDTSGGNLGGAICAWRGAGAPSSLPETMTNTAHTKPRPFNAAAFAKAASVREAWARRVAEADPSPIPPPTMGSYGSIKPKPQVTIVGAGEDTVATVRTPASPSTPTVGTALSGRSAGPRCRLSTRGRTTRAGSIST